MTPPTQLSDDTAAAHLAPDLLLPDITLTATIGPPVTLGQLSRAVVYVYPYTGRPGIPDPPDWDIIAGAHGSTPQTAGFRDHHAGFAALGYAIYGLSTQTTPWQREVSDRLQLPFALLCDEHFALADALRLPRFTTGGVDYLKRLTLIIHDGAIAATVYPIADPADHARALLARLTPAN